MADEDVLATRLLAAEFARKGKNAARDAQRASHRFGRRMVARVRMHAQGRPGPERVTGDYWKSITYDVSYTRGGYASTEVGSDEPQAMRLELGFTGQDSLGRMYDQPPFPHYRPAADELEGAYEEYMAGIADLDLIREIE